MDDLICRLARHQPPIPAGRLGRWGTAEPALAGAAHTAELIGRCHQTDRRTANATLAALLRVAAWDRAAAEVALVALAPGLGRVAAGFRWAGDVDEVRARVVTEGWAAILELAGRPPDWPAAAVLDRVRDRVRAQLVAERRRQSRTARLNPLTDACVWVAEAEGGGEVDDVLGGLVAAGRLGPADAWLIRVTRLEGLSLAEVARATGERHDGLRRRRARAERSLWAAA